ncbi:MAG TPA: RidA family protein [Acidimicrobiia bacterium]|jgi:enamine deaminase RidA (YjgF/YER057c/UK114 family)
MTRHRLFNPEGMPPAVGFSYGVIPDAGRTLHIAGITGHRADGTIAGDLVAQFGAACRSVAEVIGDAGGRPTDLVSMTIYTTDIEGYRAGLSPIGDAYRGVFGKHYPPMALFGISELFDPAAKVELLCVAVIPNAS